MAEPDDNGIRIGKALETLAGGCQEAVLLLGDHGLKYLNDHAARILGAEVERLLGKPAADLVDPPPSGLPVGGSVAWQARVKSPAAAGRVISITAHALEGGEQLWFLRPTSSLAELGSLAAGLVHNLAGPLSVVRSSAELLDIYLSQTMVLKPEIKEMVDAWPQSVRYACHNIIEQVDQITVATRDLLAKLRGEAARHHGSLNLNAILRREMHFLQNDLAVKHNVECHLNLDPSLPDIKGLYSDFSQSFRNIINNAVEAMRHSERRVLQIGTSTQKDSVKVAFTDTGQGMTPEVKERIFEPFFTTGDSASQSSGLGLHSVRQLLSPYRASFDVQSRPGHTTISIVLPLERSRDDSA